MAVFDVDEYFRSLKTKYNIPDDDLKGVEEVKKGFLRQDEFSRRSQKLDADYQARVKQEDEFHQQLLTAKQKLDLVDQLEANYGPVDQWSDTLAASVADRFPGLANDTRGRGGSDYDRFNLQQIQQTMKQAIDSAVAPIHQKLAATEQSLADVSNGAAVMMDFMSDVPEQWKERYGNRFPKDEFGKFFAEYAKKTGVRNPFAAFEAFERPHAEKHLIEKHKLELDAAKKEGYQSAMSKYGHVESPSTPNSEGMFFQIGKAEQERQAQAAAAKAKPNSGDPNAQPPREPADIRPPSDDVQYEEKRHRVGSSYQKALDAAQSGKIPGATPGQ